MNAKYSTDLRRCEIDYSDFDPVKGDLLVTLYGQLEGVEENGASFLLDGIEGFNRGLVTVPSGVALEPNGIRDESSASFPSHYLLDVEPRRLGSNGPNQPFYVALGGGARVYVTADLKVLPGFNGGLCWMPAANNAYADLAAVSKSVDWTMILLKSDSNKFRLPGDCTAFSTGDIIAKLGADYGKGPGDIRSFTLTSFGDSAEPCIDSVTSSDRNAEQVTFGKGQLPLRDIAEPTHEIPQARFAVTAGKAQALHASDLRT